MTPSDIRIGFAPIARPTFDLGLANEMTAQVYAALSEGGYDLIGSQDLIMDGAAIDARIAELAAADIDMILMLQSSFADSTMILQLARALNVTPLLVWALPEERVGATIHSNRRKPLLMQFPLKPGRVTIARLSEATGEFRLVISGGELLNAPPAFTGTSGIIRFDSGAAAVMDAIMREGLEHHVSLTYGDHQDALVSLASILDLSVLRL
jgi:L-arabinose isomerase